MAEHMLTTLDNPFDPFTQFDEWNAFDQRLGYQTAALLARVVRSSHDLSDADQSLAIEQAIDEIVTENVTGMYRKVESSNT
jgi:hypothetical protein